MPGRFGLGCGCRCDTTCTICGLSTESTMEIEAIISGVGNRTFVSCPGGHTDCTGQLNKTFLLAYISSGSTASTKTCTYRATANSVCAALGSSDIYTITCVITYNFVADTYNFTVIVSNNSSQGATFKKTGTG